MKSLLIPCFIFPAILLIVAPVTTFTQETGSFSGFNSKEFGLTVERAEITARVAIWDPRKLTGYIAVDFMFPRGHYQTEDANYFYLEPLETSGVVFGSDFRPEPETGKDGTAIFVDGTTLLQEFSVNNADSDMLNLAVIAHLQLCDPVGTCLPPDKENLLIPFNINSQAIQADATVQEILDWNAKVENAGARVEGNLLLYLLMAFLGGIMLNFLPCILPLLSVKALGLIKQATGERKSIRYHAWFYIAGIELSFWILAAIVIAIKASGSLVGWGFQFQNPIYLLVLISIVWMLSLSLFDVFVIEAPQRGLEINAEIRSKGGYTGSFFTGIFAVIVATPCLAPFLGTAMGFAFFQPPSIIITFFTVTGIGFGLPFLLLGMNPGIIKRLPKPGAWMKSFREIMGFLLVGTAIYLFNSFARMAPEVVNSALWWLLILSFSAWLLGKARHPSSSTGFRKTGQIVVLLLIMGSGFVMFGQKLITTTLIDGNAGTIKSWDAVIQFDLDDFNRRIDAGETVFLEYSAEWCTICKLNQRVIHSRKVRKLMAEKNIVHIKADLTSYDEMLLRRLAEFGRAGVPLYLLYEPGKKPYEFQSYITKSQLIEKFNGL